MKKFLIYTLVLAIIFNNLYFWISSAEIVAWPDFVAKLSTAWDDTYSTNLSSISANSNIQFQIVSVADNNASDNFEYSISLPAWFQYVSSSIWSSNDCSNTSIKNNIDSNFRYSFSWWALPCTSEVIFTYKPTAWGNYTINLLDLVTSQVVKTINLSVSWNNAIIRAQTQDYNSNWYIDWYKLTFASNISWTYNNTNLKVWTLTPTLSWAISGNIAYLKFTDWVYTSWDLPQIIDTDWWIFTSVWIINNDTISEEDSASPQILRLNNTTLSLVWSWQNINIGTGNLTLEFSEKMSPNSTWAFTLNKGWIIVWTYAYNSWLDKLIFTPTSSLTAWTYSLSASIDAKDWNNNNSIIQPVLLPSLIVADTSVPVWNPIWDWTWVMINLGSIYTNNNSVQLNLLASDNVWVNEMMISNNSLFTWNSWENYSTSKNNWQLTSWAGIKTVYVKFRDWAWNVSPIYSENITYNNTTNYISFNSSNSVYTDATSITLSWGCNYISSNWTVIDTTINALVNWTPVINITCSASKTWSQTFNITAWATNTILLRYDSDNAVNNSMQVINPIPTCTPIANWTVTWTYPSCNFTCNSWYTKVGWSCVANSCAASTQVISWHTYSVPAIANWAISSIVTSFAIGITNWTITYNAQFSCTLWTVALSWTESTNSPSCSTWYYASWNACYVQNGWTGGWWWGWTYTPRDNCPNWDFSGSFYDNKCWTAPSTGTWTTVSTWTTIPWTDITNSWVTTNIDYKPISDVAELKIDNIDSVFFKNLEESNSYIKSVSKNQRADKLADAFKGKLTFEWIEYFITYDKDFVKEYNRIVNTYVLFVVQMDKYYSWDTSTNNKSMIANLYKQLLEWIKVVEAESQKEKIWFTDIEWYFASKDIVYLALKWVIKWYENNLFKPNNSVTRAEYLWIIMKALNVEVNSSITTTSYVDIPKWWSWMVKYVEKAREFGINWQIKNSKKYFRPNDPISRAEAMAMLFSISKIPVDDIQISEFTDIPSNALWMVKYVEKARELWIISWQTINWELIFRPNDPISRWETSRVITKTLDSFK